MNDFINRPEAAKFSQKTARLIVWT